MLRPGDDRGASGLRDEERPPKSELQVLALASAKQAHDDVGEECYTTREATDEVDAAGEGKAHRAQNHPSKTIVRHTQSGRRFSR